MKTEIFVLFVLFSPVTMGQTAEHYLDKGIERHNQHDYEGALTNYNKAIAINHHLTSAYFNRGTAYFALEKYSQAVEDFDMTIELDNSFIRAYFSRASAFIQLEQYEDALPDLNKVIELDQKFANALTLRGQVKCAIDDREGGCADFLRAQKLNDANAEKYLEKFCDDHPRDVELLKLNWPSEEKWGPGNRQENEEMILVEYLKKGESFENWSEMGTMQTIKGVTGVPVSKTMQMTYEQARQSCPSAKLSFLEKNETAEYPWIIFVIECPSFKEDDQPESQLWYIVQGKAALYSNFWAIKEKIITPVIRKKWADFFKSSKVVYTSE